MKRYFYIFFAIIIISGCNRPSERIENPIGMSFVYIEPGSFMMGPKNEFNSQFLKHPQHEVKITKGFYVQTTETTVGQWRVFIEQTGFKTQAEKNGYGYLRHGKNFSGFLDLERTIKGLFWDNPGYKHTDNHPVTQISWNDVQVFINWLNRKYGNYYRLPTEAEWEYVCRAGTKTHFFFGNLTKKEMDLEHVESKILGKYAWYQKNSKGYPHPVGLKKSNPWKLYDILGNVKEYCFDDYKYKFSNESVIDPVYSDREEDSKTYRGGGWHSIPGTATCSTRGRIGANEYSDLNGFRLVKDVAPEDYK